MVATLLGDVDRVVHRQLKDPGADPQRRGAHGDGRQERERVAHDAGHEVVVAGGGGGQAGCLGEVGQLERLPWHTGHRLSRSRSTGSESENLIR